MGGYSESREIIILPPNLTEFKHGTPHWYTYVDNQMENK